MASDNSIPEKDRLWLGSSRFRGTRVCVVLWVQGVKVVLSRANSGEDDPVLGRFLRFLARDIEKNPQRIEAIGRDLAEHVNSLVANIEVDLDAPLTGSARV